MKSDCETVVKEVDLILQELVGSVATPKARALEQKFALALSQYFRRLARKFPYEKLNSTAARYAVKESIESDAKSIARKATEPISGDLTFVLDDFNTRSYKLGAEQAVKVAKIHPTFNLVDDGAVKWIKSHGAEMVTNINATTTKRLAGVLEDGFRRGMSPQRLAKSIKENMGAMADARKGRSMTIARTELNDSMSQASLDTYKRLGLDGKRWLATSDCCDICSDNESDGVIPIDASFSGGVDRPPQHPNCECSLSPARLKK